MTYRDVFHQNEVEQSAYNFEHADTAVLLRHFDDHEQACTRLLAAKLALPAYEQVLQGLAHLQPAGCAPRDLGDRAPALHPARAHAGARAWRRPTTTAARRWASRCCDRPTPMPAQPPEAHERRCGERRDFLVELGTEELPPKALRELEAAFRDGIAAQSGSRSA